LSEQPVPETCSARRNMERAAPGFLFGLAPDGVFRALSITRQAVSSYLTFSPLPRPCGRGGLFSVALSVEMLSHSSRVYLDCGVTRHRALWCSDFPPPAFTAGSDSPPFRNQAKSNPLRPIRNGESLAANPPRPNPCPRCSKGCGRNWDR
jgi:hypothetical protein